MTEELLLSASLVVVVDQLSKKIVMCQLAEGQLSSVGSLLRIRLVINVGSSLGLARNRLSLLLLWSFTVLSVFLVVRYGEFFQNQIAQVGLGAALGGATGNLFDRLWRGAIIDFIDFGFWPVFNLADIAIVLGTGVALWFIR